MVFIHELLEYKNVAFSDLAKFLKIASFIIYDRNKIDRTLYLFYQVINLLFAHENTSIGNKISNTHIKIDVSIAVIYGIIYIVEIKMFNSFIKVYKQVYKCKN